MNIGSLTSRRIMRCLSLSLVLVLAGCASEKAPPQVCPPCAHVPIPPAAPPSPLPVPSPQPAPTPPAVAKPLQPAQWEDLPGWGADDLRPAFDAFMQSCRAMRSQSAWADVCEAGARLEPADGPSLQAFFVARFNPYRAVNADGSVDGLITGYYEPVIRASRVPSTGYRQPIYAPPDDMLTIDLGEIYPELKKLRLRGRLEGRKVVPYYDRAGIEQRADALRSKVLYWAHDPLALFFLQVQGSGQLQLPDGSRVRVGYADQNGYPYKSIGRWLVDAGELKLDEASMQGIQAWARAHPDRLAELLAVNPSYVFFRDLGTPAAPPPGAQGVPLADERSLAVDPHSIPLGAPVWLATSYPGSDRPLQRLMVAQDTGGAIKGVVRADFFWGSGPAAGREAGRMKQPGRMWILLPKGYPLDE